VETITLTINGNVVSGLPHLTILELAREQSIPIPTLCFHPSLSRAGACRVCLVEDESRGGVLLPSCVTAIAPGMVLQTHSPRVLETRRTIVQLLLASHPESCVVCDKGNRCRLRALAADLGIGATHLDPMPQYFPTFDINPFFKRDMSKCILCGQCLRGDQELVVEGVLDYIHRGFNARPATFRNLPLEQAECTFCGTCLSLCPTGALTETQLVHQGTLSRSVETVCGHCACGCPLSLETVEGRVVRAAPGRDFDGQGPVLCVRGHFGFNYIHHRERLLHPLVRKNGVLEPTSWSEALAQVHQGFHRLQEAFGPEQLGCLTGAYLTNEELYLFQKLARLALKTPNLDNGSRISMAPALLTLHQALGQAGASQPLEKILEADTLLVIGADPAQSAPVLGYLIKRAVSLNNARLILIDPRKTGLASWASHWLRPRPSSDLALLQILIRQLMAENRWNQGFVSSQTEGFLEWRESLLKQDLRSALNATGLSEELIRGAAKDLSRANGLAIVFGSGITQQINASAMVMALVNLHLLTGQWGNTRSGIYPVLKESNAQGAWDMGVLPDFFPGYIPVSDSQARKHLEAKWQGSLPEGAGMSALEMIAAAQQSRLQGLYIVGEDPLGAYPDRAWVEEGLDCLSFLVVQDLFLTETARQAQVVLPAASFAEKEGTVTTLERRVRLLDQALPPLGDSKPDGEIFNLLLEAWGFPQGKYHPERVLAEIRGTVPSYVQVNRDLLSRQPVFIPAQKKSLKAGIFQIPKIHLDPLDPEKDFPFTLISSGLLYHQGTGTRTWKDWRLKAVTPEPAVSLSSADAQRLHITAGDRVRLRSRRGTVVIKARVEETVPPGTLFAARAYPELRLNALIEAGWDPSTKGALHKGCAVQVEKWEAARDELIGPAPSPTGEVLP
jgi:formate dehydrogenase (NADP+) alpha subunit